MSVAFLCGTLGLVLPLPSHADVQFGGIKKISKPIFPRCGPGTRDQRLVVSKDGTSVCDNKTGLWWEQNPSTAFFTWQQAIDRCATLTLSGKTWRLPEVKEYQWYRLLDSNQPMALNTPNGPFQNVQPTWYWSATELRGYSTHARIVHVVYYPGSSSAGKGALLPAWCVSDGEGAPAH